MRLRNARSTSAVLAQIRPSLRCVTGPTHSQPHSTSTCSTRSAINTSSSMRRSRGFRRNSGRRSITAHRVSATLRLFSRNSDVLNPTRVTDCEYQRLFMSPDNLSSNLGSLSTFRPRIYDHHRYRVRLSTPSHKEVIGFEMMRSRFSGTATSTQTSIRNLGLPLPSACSGQSSIILNAACRSPGFNLRNSVRAFLTFCSEPVSTATLKATVVGWSAPQIKTKAFARRSMAARSIVAFSIQKILV
jgi:hypothetical protein